MREASIGSAPGTIPAELSELLDARSTDADTGAWERFVNRYSRLLLHTAHRSGRGYDDAMDRYAFVLERLRENGAARLRHFRDAGRGQFTTWLVVVARRLCDDFHRHKYGRLRAGDDERGLEARARHDVRRRLLDLVGNELRIDHLPAANGGPEMSLRRAELGAALEAALGELEPGDRLMLKLRYEEDMSARQIAGFMKMESQFHVYRRLKSVLKTVRESLREQGVDGPRP